MHYYFIDILRFIATLLITNSHYTPIWPISAMALGGSLGNTLFFGISGYCLSVKENSKFPQWITNRIIRIYPATAIVTTIMFVFVYKEVSGVGEFIHYFIYPTEFWFVSAIMVFYLLYYIIVKYFKKYIVHILIAVSLLYFIIYVFALDTSVWAIETASKFKWIYYFIVMMLSYWIKENNILEKIDKKTGKTIVISAVTMYVLLKIATGYIPMLNHVQFIFHVLSLIFMFGCMCWGFSVEKSIETFLTTSLGKICAYIGECAFEIYLIQTFCIRHFSKYKFPLNFFIVTTLILLSAILVHYLAGRISRKFKRKRG